MNNSTTNGEIALKLGWKKIQGDKATPYFWLWSDGSTRRNPPDYEHDWAHAGPLLVELLEWYGRLEFGHEFFVVRLLKGKEHKGKTLTEAISRAWLAWKKEEKSSD